jgi:hypothetical protein
MLTREKQLLCTFTNNGDYSLLLSKISNFYTILEHKLFIFANVTNLKEYYLTYNVDCRNTTVGKFPNTISIHRKKMYNTLYTLNGMNRLITDENNGVFDKTYQLNWELYRNSLILTTDIGVKVVGLKLVDIVTM